MQVDGIPYVVTPMLPDDVPAVAALEKMVFTLPWSAHAFDYELQYNPMAHFFVLRLSAGPQDTTAGQEPGMNPVASRVLGYGGLWQIIDEAHICTLAVHPDWRGRGLGELLLVRLIEEGVVLGAAVATLEVRASNLTAQHLYRKYGFEVVGVRKAYYSDNHENALIMTTCALSAAAFQRSFRTRKAALRARLAAGALRESTEA